VQGGLLVQSGMDPCAIANGLVDSRNTTNVRRPDDADPMRRIISDYAVTLPVPDYIDSQKKIREPEGGR
jgi:hypothetical protein